MRTPTRPWRTLLPALLALALPATAQAQYARPPTVPAHALTGVTVVQADGARTEGVTIVVRGGVIEAMGPDVQVPADARLLEGDSLLVYPGLIDAHGAVEPDFGEVEPDDPPLSWAPSRAVQGFVPHRRAVDFITATGEDLEDARQGGVVASAVHPDAGMAAGHSAVLVHRGDAPDAWGLVAHDALGPSLTLKGAGGVYPSTIFGVIALLRQSFLDAQRAGRIAAAYADDPRGMPAPRLDPDYAALQPALAGAEPVFFAADSQEDIRRVLRLQDEFGFRPVIVGGAESGALATELAERGVPVLFSVAFQTPADWDPEDEGELTPAAAREKERLEAVYGGPAALHRAGVTFALTSGGSGAELREGTRKAIEYGLPPEAALAALTTTPATLLRIPNVVRVEEGMAATFVALTGEIFDEDADVAYTLVDGVVQEGASAAGGEAPAANLTGEWDMTINAQGMQIAMKLTLEQDGAELSGSLESAEMGNSEVTGGTVSGTAVTMEVSSPQLPEPLTFTGTMNDDGTRITGSASTPFGELSFTARKSPGAEGRREGGVR